jgi:hypothetical protein
MTDDIKTVLALDAVHALADVLNEASASFRKIREWCDSNADLDCSHASEAECRRCEVIKDCAREVRALLPPVPPARGEEDVNNDRDL